MSVTLRDVARKAGYSVTTVSRALNGFPDVNEQTRLHIVAVARELGYTPNLSARQLQTRRSDTLGFVIPVSAERASEPFFTEFLGTVGTEAARHGFDLLVTALAPDTHEVDAYRRLAQSGRVDGIILIRGRRVDARVALLQQLNFPFVLFGRTDTESGYAWIDVDGTAGMRAATEHLLAEGHRRIAFVTGPSRYTFVAFRQEGYETALRDAGLPVDPELIVAVEQMTERDGYTAAQTLLKRRPRPTAIVAITDLVAYGVMRALHRAGLRIGKDIAVVGFDGLGLSAFTTPPLTSVTQPITEIGRQAVQMLLTIIKKESESHPHVLLRPALIVRESSTGRPSTLDPSDVSIGNLRD
jgi:LacI family transcriptional regulator